MSDAFEIVGLVSRGPSAAALAAELPGPPAFFSSFAAGLKATNPDVVCISTYPDTHEEYAVATTNAALQLRSSDEFIDISFHRGDLRPVCSKL